MVCSFYFSFHPGKQKLHVDLYTFWHLLHQGAIEVYTRQICVQMRLQQSQRKTTTVFKNGNGKSLELIKQYCWWKKSQTTSWYVKYPIIHKVSYIPGGAGILPSTVPQTHKPPNALLNHAKYNIYIYIFTFNIMARNQRTSSCCNLSVAMTML